MAIALAQSFLGGNNTTTAVTPFNLTASATFPSAVAAGSCIVMHATSKTNVSGSSPTLQPNVTGGPFANWNNVSTAINISSPAATRTVWIAYLPNSPAITLGDTISAVFVMGGSGVNTTLLVEFAVYVFTGVQTTGSKFSPLETSHVLTGTSSTPSTANLVTVNTDLILSAFFGDSGNLSAGSGYTLGTNMTVNTFGSLQYILNQASGSIATAFSGGTETNWAAASMALKPAPAVAANSYGFFLS